MKVWVYKIYFDLPTGRTLVRTVRIAAESEDHRDKLFELWYGGVDRKELIEVIDSENRSNIF